MDDAGEASLVLEAVKGLAPPTANLSGNRDGKKKFIWIRSVQLGARDSASSSLLAVTVKESKGMCLKGFHMMQLHLS